MRWNRKTILDEIRELYQRGDELNFSSAEENHLNLVRAAVWHYGTWKSAVELAGFDYEAVSKYRRWTRERVLQAIRGHYAAGHDLSWRSTSTALDPSLAAAALRPSVGFETWREALIAAGISHDEVARYRHWTPERVIEEITAIADKNEPLSSKIVQNGNQPLYCAARRRFQSWNGALKAAGIDPQTVRLRRAPRQNPRLETSETAALLSLPTNKIQQVGDLNVEAMTLQENSPREKTKKAKKNKKKSEKNAKKLRKTATREAKREPKSASSRKKGAGTL